jgi:glycosyltransferase involved in cell wall biosynthesis
MVFLTPSYHPIPSQATADGTADGLESHAKIFQFPRPQSVRVLHLINGEHFSGAERVQQLLGKRLPEQNVDPHFVCLKEGKFSEMCGLDPGKVSVQAMKSRVDFTLVRKIAQQAKEINADLLHAHTPRSALIASFVAKVTGLPWVFHVHSPTARDSTRALINRMNDWMERRTLRSSDHIITVSKSLRREMLKRGYGRQKINCIPNGVAEQIPIDAFHRINDEKWTLGMVALIRPRKGIEVLLEAMARVKQNAPNVKLDVVGAFETKEYEAEVMKLVRKLQLEAIVQFQGFTRDVPKAMRKLDAMVLPSLFGEGMPMVVLEALALGVPVIATKVEGTPEVVRDRIEGLLAEPRDPASLAHAIEKFVSSRSRWTEMSQHAVERHRSKFSDVEMARRTAAVYRKMLVRR